MVGAGRISKQHLAAFDLATESVQLVGVCDADKKAAESCARERNVPAVASMEDVLLMKPEAVLLGTPSGLHAEQASFFLERSIHVITEKPLAVDVHDAAKVCVDQSTSHGKVFVLQQLRTLAIVQQIKELLANQCFGVLAVAQVNVFRTRPQAYFDAVPWRGNQELDGGALLNQASHYLDLLLWFLDAVRQVRGISRTLARDIESEDSVVASIEFESGALATVSCTVLSYPRDFEDSITLIGTEGTLKIRGKTLQNIDTFTFKHDESLQPNIGDDTSLGMLHARYFQEVCLALRAKRTPGCIATAEEGFQLVSLINAIHRSSTTQRAESPYRIEELKGP